MNVLFSRADRSVLGRWWWTVDRYLLAAVFVLIGCGVTLIATASPPVAARIGVSQFHFLTRHLLELGPSLLIMLGVSLLSPRGIWRVATLALAGALAGMVLVLFVGMEIKGAQRWIHVPFLSIQPSEFAKVSFAIVAAWLIARQKEDPSFPGYKIATGLYCVTVMLLLMEPDLGMSVVVSCIFGAEVFLAGFPMWIMMILGGLGACGLVGAYFAFDHVHSRIERFLDPTAGDNYQVEKALEAFRNGGVLGTGPGQGVVKLGLPDAHADFIFAVAGEELGLVFIYALTALFAFIVLRGFNRLKNNGDMFAVLGAGGLLTMFGVQALVHMGSSLHLLPAKGMTLPFISYGGSSLLSMSFAMGIILALTRLQARTSIARGGRIMRKRPQQENRGAENEQPA
jgi:cell division protein FtsW